MGVKSPWLSNSSMTSSVISPRSSMVAVSMRSLSPGLVESLEFDAACSDMR